MASKESPISNSKMHIRFLNFTQQHSGSTGNEYQQTSAINAIKLNHTRLAMTGALSHAKCIFSGSGKQFGPLSVVI